MEFNNSWDIFVERVENINFVSILNKLLISFPKRFFLLHEFLSLTLNVA